MIYFEVVDYEKLQHYKDRNPPWIKLYNDLLDNYEFSCLQDASKLHLIMIYLVASRHANKIPYDEKWIARRINASDSVNLKLLEERGFIKRIKGIEDASVMLASCSQNAMPETETETETERDKKNIKKEIQLQSDFEIFWTAYPRKEDKQRALKAFQKLKPNPELIQRMVDAIERQEQMRTLEKRYRNFDRAWKMPTTWLNGKNWEDEVNLNEEDWKNESLQRTGKPHIESLVERSRRERAERKIHAQPNPYIDDEAVPIGIEQPR